MFCPTTFKRTHEALDALADYYKNGYFSASMPLAHPLASFELGGGDRFAAYTLIHTAFTSPIGIVDGINNTSYGDRLFAAIFPGQERVQVSVDMVGAAIFKLNSEFGKDCN